MWKMSVLAPLLPAGSSPLPAHGKGKSQKVTLYQQLGCSTLPPPPQRCSQLKEGGCPTSWGCSGSPALHDALPWSKCVGAAWQSTPALGCSQGLPCSAPRSQGPHGETPQQGWHRGSCPAGSVWGRKAEV